MSYPVPVSAIATTLISASSCKTSETSSSVANGVVSSVLIWDKSSVIDDESTLCPSDVKTVTYSASAGSSTKTWSASSDNSTV